MTGPDTSGRPATDPALARTSSDHSAQNDAEFPDDERGVTGARDGVTGATLEGQTARDVFPEDDGVPDVSQDDFPTTQRAEDPQFAPEPGDRDDHRTVDFGTTAAEQAEGESLSGRLEREVPDDASGIRPAEDPDRAFAQLDQDQDVEGWSDSGTNRTGDDVEAFADAPVAGEGPEESAVHVIETS